MGLGIPILSCVRLCTARSVVPPLSLAALDSRMPSRLLLVLLDRVRASANAANQLVAGFHSGRPAIFPLLLFAIALSDLLIFRS